MKKTFKCVCWLFLIVLGVCLLSLEPLYTPTAISTQAHHAHFPRYIAHKALVSGRYKGNTFEAIEEALGSYVDGIEVDVRFSADHVPFLYHGNTLEEYTNGRGIPEEHTWLQLQQLSYLGTTQSKIVALDDVLKLVGSQKSIFLNIKSARLLNSDFAHKIVDLIHRYHLEETVIVESFNPFFLISMRLTARDILLMYDFTSNTKAMGEEIQAQFDTIPWIFTQPFFQKQVRRLVRPDILGPRWNMGEQSLISLMAHGYPIICWTVDDIATAQKLFKLGVKGVQTNTPIQLMETTSQSDQIVYDSGGSRSKMSQVIHVKKPQDILDALHEARAAKKKITIAGRRHSMGGQTLLDDSIHLNMMGLNHVHYNTDTHTVTVGAGATWKKVQSILNQHGRSVAVMQSDNIFSVGGSVGVNVHGWQVGRPPISSTVLSLKLITAGGHLLKIDKNNNPQLFSIVMGGYGQFGIIIEAELETVPNSTLKFHGTFVKPHDFVAQFQEKVTNNPKVELAYGRLSVDKDHLFEEAGLFWYEKVAETASTKVDTESLIALKRAIFRSSQYLALGKQIRWSVEKLYAKKSMNSPPVSRNTAMNSDIHIIWPLYGQNKDILHEYFIPKARLADFLSALKKLILSYDMNILNVTIREVRKDTTSVLPYATQDMFGLVLLFSQSQNQEDEKKMAEFTQKIIDEALKLKGTFYLPYRLHYRKEQLLSAYPGIGHWIQLKALWDKEQLFDSQFFEHINSLVT